MSLFKNRKGLKVSTEDTVKNEKKTIHDDAMDWEASRIYRIEQSERRAWKIAISAVIALLISLIAIMLMTPLKQTIPYVVRVDNVTGVPDIVTTMRDQRVDYDDVMDKYWLATYVRARETYDWYTIQKDYDAVGILSSSNVGTDYASLFEGADALDKKLGKKYTITVDVISVVPNGKGTGTVRFIKTTKLTGSKNEGQKSKYVATIGYEYHNPSKMKESVRLVNPFGFQVISYRVDPELAGDTK